MRKIERHPFGGYAPENSTTLILGSFPCFNGKDYGDWFYGGSGVNTFWKILSEIYGLPANNRAQKEAICIAHKIAITDIAYAVHRKKENDCGDKYLEIIEDNKKGIEECLSVGITKILFTSKFVEQHFKRMFPKIQMSTDVLISPSPAANIYIATLEEYKRMIKSEQLHSPYEYRVFKYKALLPQ